MNMRSKGIAAVIAAVSLLSQSEIAQARPTVGVGNTERRSTLKTTAAQCNPATANIDLDINNVRSRLMTGGDMWWDRGTGTARYEVPKGSGKNSLFAGSVWVGGVDGQGALKVAAQMYRTQGNDYWPGPTQVDANNVNSAPDKTICSDWDQFWKINRTDLTDFREAIRAGSPVTDARFTTIREWPATGNSEAKGTSGLPLSQLTNPDYKNFGRNFAPFVDVDGDGLYDYTKGDYPDILGDQYIWWVFNDMGNVKLQTNTQAIGMEVQTSSFAFSTKDYLNDATFVFYKLINRGTLTLFDTYMATWTDADLGQAFDDYIGCDTGRSLGILYNGKSTDGNGSPTDYGSEVPMIGVDFFIGPKRRTYSDTGHHQGPNGRYDEDTLGMTIFNYFNNANNSPIGDPGNGVEVYRIMTGFNRVGQHLHNDQASCPNSNGYGNGPEIPWVFPGNPNVSGEWSECQCGTPVGDRRFVHSSGPFTLEAGGITNDIIIGACWVPNVGGCPNTSFSRIRAADDMIQDLFDNHFKTIEGPEAPDLTIREMDRKLVFYITNPVSSTNYLERFGRYDSSYYRVSTPKTRRGADSSNHYDSLYKFEGYRVFQLKNSTVTPNLIFNEAGEVNKELAAEVFQCDVKNGVNKIVNYVGNPDKASGVFDAAVKVTGKDSGIVHSFALTTDAFATGPDKKLVNYRNYYYVAIAYSYNNFRQFTYALSDSSQQTPYLESSHGANGRNIAVYSPMPNPANGDFGTVLNADFGSGVIIKRMEGIGNGGIETSFDAATEADATSPATGNKSLYPVYPAGYGPVGIKVIDPQKIKPLDWELYLYDTIHTTSNLMVDSTAKWKLVNSNGETIYSDRTLNQVNEQILADYGLSVSVHQVGYPGDESAVANNGYINSTISYADPARAWLAGVNDAEQQNPLNWIRSGKYGNPAGASTCEYNDKGMITGTGGGISGNNPDSNQYYEGLFPLSTPNKGTWAPATLAVKEPKGDCGFGIANSIMQGNSLHDLPGVDIVFTSDKSKWTRSVVLEMQDEKGLAQNHAAKFRPRGHASWNMQIGDDGRPVYSTTPGDTGFSWFPGYAVNQETGERVNIIFSEDSYQPNANGTDMIWNPTNQALDPKTGNVVYGGKHYVYILSSKYDSCKDFIVKLQNEIDGDPPNQFRPFQWVGVPLLLGNNHFNSLNDGLIPTEARLRIRVSRPYERYIADPSQQLKNNGFPLYSFSTKNLAPKPLADNDNHWSNDKQGLLDQIMVTPNPYYGTTGYENNRLDTRVRIINLPRKATIRIYSVDGTLIRTLTKDNANQSFVDWDTRNQKGLNIASGMYLFHISADGIGETIVRWFGAMRPTDITTY
jgi:hypothetical protein